MRAVWRQVRRVARAVVIAALGLAALSVLQVLAARFVDPPTTATVVQRAVEHALAGEGLAWPDRRPLPLSALGSEVPRAVVGAEDARFFLHHGFDWEGICDAWRKNAAGGRLRGGSSLTQQVAKNVFLWQGRSWLRKGLEVWYTIWLELLLPKERILELYLNVAETGPMVFGAEAGARHHFGKAAAKLSADEAGRLAGVLPDPRRRSVSGESARERARWLRANRAPFPGDPGFEQVRDRWRERNQGPLDCLLRSTSASRTPASAPIPVGAAVRQPQGK